MLAFVCTLVNYLDCNNMQPSCRYSNLPETDRSCFMKFDEVEEFLPMGQGQAVLPVFTIVIVTDLWKKKLVVAHQSAMSHVSMTTFTGANAPMRNPHISKEETLVRERFLNFDPFGHLHVCF